MAAPRLGFIGLGLMGHGMGKNLLRAGYGLTVLAHRNRGPVDDLLGRGAREAADPAAVAAASDIVILCLPSSREVDVVFAGERGLLAGCRSGMIVVDTTTADPDTTRRLGAVLAEGGVALVDAALGRTPKEAEEGRLSTYVGGDPAVVETLRPILSAFADTIVVCGPLGAGTTCKLINNSISLGTAVLISEGFATAAKAGVDLTSLADVLSAGPANGGIWRMMAPWIRGGDDSHLKGRIDIVAKDLRTYSQLADKAGAAVPVAEVISTMLQDLLEQGHGEVFLPRLPGILAARNGVKIEPKGE